MRIKVDYEKEKITLDSRQIHYLEGYLNHFLEFAEEYTRIRSSIRKYFIVDGINYTDLIAHMFYQNDYYFSKAPGLITILNYLDLLNSLDEKSELKLEINDFYYKTFAKCAELVGAKKKFKIRKINERYAKRRLDFLYNNPRTMKNFLRSRYFFRFILGKIRKILGKHNKEKADVLFLSNIRFENNRPENNSMFGSVIVELNKRRISNKILRYEELERLFNLKRFIKKFFLQKEAYLGDYYSLKHFLRCNKDFKLLRKRWNAVKNNPEFKRIFTYKGHNYYDLIKPKLGLTFNALSYIACDSKNIARAIMDKENYEVLVLDHEENLYGKGFMLNSRLDKKRKILALSHELIHLACVHIHIRNKEALNRNSVLWRPLPDVKCVWSEYSKKILLESCNYPENIIRITGNPKFDFLFKGEYDADKIIKKYGLSKTKKRVLCAPSPVNLGYFDELNEVSKKAGNCEFIIKPHPGESKIMQIRKRVKQFHNPNMKYVDNKDDIYPLIHISDYVVTDTSTVAFEGMLADKLVFTCWPAASPIPPFLKGNIQIKRIPDLVKELSRLRNKQTLDKIKAQAKKITEYYHHKSPSASELIAKEVEKLL